MISQKANDAIRECPFCGNKAELFQRELFDSDHDYSKDDDNWDIRCASENCYLCDGADCWLTKELAIEKWNKRSPITQDWISVEERLPEKYIEVWVYTGAYIHDGIWNGDTWNWQDYPSSNKESVTHWMPKQPLPSPPKESE